MGGTLNPCFPTHPALSNQAPDRPNYRACRRRRLPYLRLHPCPPLQKPQSKIPSRTPEIPLETLDASIKIWPGIWQQRPLEFTIKRPSV